jgi:uncharacterized protein YecT (DUF1311 family)
MRLSIATTLVLFAACSAAQARDCKNATVPAEVVVCSNPRLIKLVDQRDRALAAARARADAGQRQTLMTEQRRWLREYPRSCGVGDPGKPLEPTSKEIVACFARAITARTEALHEYVAVPAKPAVIMRSLSSAEPMSTPPAGAAISTAPPAGNTYRLKFTFACRSRGKMVEVLAALKRNDFSFPLNQNDCLPVPAGRVATLLGLDGKAAKVRLCSAAAGCVEVYTDAAALETADGGPARLSPTAAK